MKKERMRQIILLKRYTKTVSSSCLWRKGSFVWKESILFSAYPLVLLKVNIMSINYFSLKKADSFFKSLINSLPQTKAKLGYFFPSPSS